MTSTRSEYIAITVPIVDRRVQRVENLDKHRVAKIAADFNENALGAATLSERPNGDLIIIDGMHRIAAAREVGYTGRIFVIIHTGLSLEEEKRLFDQLNNSKAVSALTHFVMRVGYRESVAVAINDVLTSWGWTVASGSSEGCFGAVDAIETVFRHGARSVAKGAHIDLVERAVSTITAAWGHDWRAMNASIVKGVGKLYGRYGELIVTKKLVSEMEKTTPYALLAKAKAVVDFAGGTKDAGVARVLTGMHNTKMRANALPDWVWTR